MQLVFYFFVMFLMRHIRVCLVSAALLAMLCLPCCGPVEPEQDQGQDQGQEQGQEQEQKQEQEIPDEPPPVDVSSILPDPFSWIAVDGQGNSIDPDLGIYPEPEKRAGKTVAIFYFLWHGCHGYDRPGNSNSVVPPYGYDVHSPYNIQQLLDENPSAPALGDYGIMHHWGEPYLGYYVSNDEWVIRKHAQMLVDAGVDAVFFDVTNGYHYLPVVQKLATVYTQMRAEGNNTPQFAFLLNTNVPDMSRLLYKEIYAKGLFQDLWFTWLGKPLLLAKANEVPAEILDKFTLRQSWFTYGKASSDAWFGTGEDKWPWGGWYPQPAGKHGGRNESVSVMPATHPISKMGRSFDVTTNTEPLNPSPGKGIYFKKQFERAMALDPQLLFFTGWNEWTAQRQPASKCPPPYFVDQYNYEFSRDIEPLNGGFGDNYYYLMADFIRKFKGASRPAVFRQLKDIVIDGSFSEWESVAAAWADDFGDVSHRNWFGWGRIGQYVNTTGRNDIVLVKAVNDGENMCFYVKTASALSPCSDVRWMQLFLRVDGTGANWEGYDFVVNRTVLSDGSSLLEKSKGGWKWTKVAGVKFAVSGCEMELAIPLSAMGIKDADSFAIDFKWVDNAAGDGDIQTCMRDGDSAPNGRFRYRYKFLK